MQNKKRIVIIIIIILVIASLFGLYFFFFRNPNKLNSVEKKYLAENATNIQNINVLNNVNVFGRSGEGLYYDFIEDFKKNYGIEVNTVSFNLGEEVSDISFGAGNEIGKNEISFYEDHYVLVNKKYEFLSQIDDLSEKKIGVLANNLSYVSNYLQEYKKITITSYENDEKLLKAFEEQNEIQSIIVPMHLYLDEILSKEYNITYHFSDLKYYYKFNIGENNLLGSILKKYYNDWSLKDLNQYYYNHLFNLFINSLNISLTDVDAMRSVSYNYGFVENGPYEILTGGNYGGIISQYLKEFTEFSDTEIKFMKYKNYNQFLKAVNNNKINLAFSYYNLSNSFDSVHSGIELNYNFIASKKNDLVIHSLQSLSNEEIYVEKDTYIYNYLLNNTKLNIKPYSNINSLQKLVKKDKFIIVDSRTFEAYKNSIFDSYNSRYEINLRGDYLFKLNANETFNKLFAAYLNYKDSNETIYKGIYNYEKTIQSGSFIGKIAKYFMYILIVFVFIFLYVYKVAKKVKVSKKIKKEDKLKYIDQLTSLKNRNYLNENLESWGKNTIYPQTIIVADLNNLQYINDTLGYEQGDIQIKAVANILVKTQLDNSDIIRTDGNEFVVYLIGYTTKQIISYINKLNKEFKRLPHGYGVSIGYSMIEDDIKSIEDAMNEAVEDVKKQKSAKKGLVKNEKTL